MRTFHANDCEPGMNVYLGLATNAALVQVNSVTAYRRGEHYHNAVTINKASH